MPLRRSAVCAAFAASLALPVSGAVAADHHDHRTTGGTHGPRAVLGLDAKSAKPAAGIGTERIIGADGTEYESAPQVVPGRKGDLYLGLEFDYYCALGQRFDKGVRRLGKLAKTIRNSGREVVWTIAPNKSLVVNHRVDRDHLPHGACDQAGMDEQRAVMDSTRDRRYLPLRQLLAQDKRQVYWKTDPHWTSVAGSVFSQQLAERLSPKIGRKQRYVAVHQTEIGLLNAFLDIQVPETAQGADPAPRVKVRPAPWSTPWESMPSLVFDHAWKSKPKRRTWPGHTLIIGDSFTQYTLQNLRPIFRHGRFMWIGHVDPAAMVDAIVHADTVVIEQYQSGVFNSIIGTRAFRNWVALALLQAAGA